MKRSVYFTDKNQFLLNKDNPTTATISAGNTIYIVHVEDVGSGIGEYTITTGPDHPSGPGFNVLYGDGFPGTSFNTIRSYTTNTDYVQETGSLISTNTVVNLDPYSSTELIGTTGVRTIYQLPGTSPAPDRLTITQDVNVNGTTFENSYVEVTTRITNNGTASVDVGIRYLWDFEIGIDDGPTFQAINPNGAILTNETEFSPPNFLAYQIVDNDSNPSPPTFIVFGTSTGPTVLIPRPNTPDLLQYVSWPSAIDTAFDYVINPNTDIANEPINDSAVLYFWGQNVNNAIPIPAGGSIVRSASLFATKPGVEPPFINQTACIEVIRVFGSCVQEEERQTNFYLHCLTPGEIVNCSVKEAICKILQVSEPDSSGNVIARVKVLMILNFEQPDSGNSKTFTKTYSFITTLTIQAPTGTKVFCEVSNPSCECNLVGRHLLHCTIRASVIARSKVLAYLVVPYITLCEPLPCENGSL